MLDLLGRRQKDLLRLLLRHKAGLTVDELGQRLQISRNAVRQHLTALEGGGLVIPGPTRPTGGRPTQVYALSTKGSELFPRHYGWLAQLIVESIKEEVGGAGAEAHAEHRHLLRLLRRSVRAHAARRPDGQLQWR